MTRAKTLNLGDGLRLPAEAVTQTFALIAKRGMGKTYTAAVLVEEMLELRQRLVVIDPVGVWWGLRSSADGREAGYPVVVVGGDHGDLPLEPGAGELIANLVVDRDLALIIDLSLLRKGEQRTFMTPFLETVYHRNRAPLHVVVDEADAYAPQRPVKGAERLLGAMEDLVRRGRARGLGVTLITQRPATLHKDVLTQTEVLIALRLTGPQDRAALDAWIRQHGDEEERAQLLDGLAALPVGTAWVWSPGWLQLFRRVKIRRRRTFDSSATPKVGERVATPKGYATVDLEQLRGAMADLVERAEADDPAKLRKRIHTLESERNRLARDVESLRVAPQKPEPVEVEVRVEVPVLTAEERAELQNVARGLQEFAAAASGTAERILAKVDAAARTPAPSRSHAPASSARAAAPARARDVAPKRSVEVPRDVGDLEVPLKLGARRMLAQLVRYSEQGLTRVQLGTLAGVKHTTGTFSDYLRALRTNGLISDDGDRLYPTGTGIQLAPENYGAAPMTVDELVNEWGSRLKAGARRMLAAVVAEGPLTRDELAERAELATGTGTFSDYLRALRTNGLVRADGPTISLGEAFDVAAS